MRNHELDLPGGDAEPKALTPKQTGTEGIFNQEEREGQFEMGGQGFFEGEGD